MFKNIISSIHTSRHPNRRTSDEQLVNGKPGRLSPPAARKQPLPNKQPDNQKTSNGHHKMADEGQLEGVGDANRASARRTLSARGRKKLSAVLGMLQSIGKKEAKEANNRSGSAGNKLSANKVQPANPRLAHDEPAQQGEQLELEANQTAGYESNHEDEYTDSYSEQRAGDCDCDCDTDSCSSREFLSAEFDLDSNPDEPAKGDQGDQGGKAARAADEREREREREHQRDDDAYEYDEKANYVLPEEQCDIPTFLQTKNCDPYLIEETRRLLRERYVKSPENFYEHDYKRMLSEDWTVSRFLLRRRLDPKRTAKLMEECGRFRKQYKMSEVQLWEFPIEFHKAGGLFKYAPDRVGNLTVYMRVKMYRRVPEISDVFKAFILCVLEEADKANGGRGTAVIFDLSGCGLQNVDLAFLSWLLSSFRNYCPKGVSYILVYNLPWILNATCKIAMTWMSASNRRALRFVHGDEIENFIERQNLPDYLGGGCKLNYRAVPEGAKPATEVCGQLDMTREQALKIRELFREYLDEEDFTEEERLGGAKPAKGKKHAPANGATGAR